MLNPAEMNKVAMLISEKKRLSEKIVNHLTDKEEELKILSLANDMETNLCTSIEQSAKRGHMRFGISDLSFMNAFCGLSQAAISDMLTLLDYLIRKIKTQESRPIVFKEYPSYLKQLLSSPIPLDSRLNLEQTKISVLSLLNAISRFESAGFLILPVIEIGQRANIYISWGGEGFFPHATPSDDHLFSDIRIAELKAEIEGLRNVEKMQERNKQLMAENKRLRESLDYLMIMKSRKEETEEKRNVRPSGEV